MSLPTPALGAVSEAVSAMRAVRMARKRAALLEAQDHAALPLRIHRGAMRFTQRNPLRMASLGALTAMLVVIICIVDVSEEKASLRDYAGGKVGHYKFMMGLSGDVDGASEVMPLRKLQSSDDNISWSPAVASARALATCSMSKKGEITVGNTGYAECVTEEKNQDKIRAGMFFISGDSRLTTLDCAATRLQWKPGTLYQIDLCVSDGQPWKDVEVKDSKGNLQKCDPLQCDEDKTNGDFGRTKGQGRHCLGCPNPANTNLWRLSKHACPEICLQSSKMGYLPLYLLGMFYMFIALAIIVDEFFVPALELFVDEAGISMDVAGATFMAAGGSMPELFTSFLGTFRESTVGFSTIVGSAVFNVLFVIGVCAISSKEDLQLTWWPLARDCSFYMIALLLVTLVFKFNTESQIDLWEAILLLAVYGSYCGFMKINAKAEKWIKSKLPGGKAVKVVDEETAGAAEKVISKQKTESNVNFAKPSTFRVGIVQLLTQNVPFESAGIAAVTQIRGNMKETFEQLDKDGSGLVDVVEMVAMIKELGFASDIKDLTKELRRVSRQVGDGSAQGKISFEVFEKWYRLSEARVEIEVHRVFAQFDKDGSGHIDRDEVTELLKSLNHDPDEAGVAQAMQEIMEFDAEEDDVVNIAQPKKTDGVTFKQFSAWYNQSLFWNEYHEQHVAEDEEENGGFHIDLPDKDAGRMAWTVYIISYPLSCMMYCSLPDVRREGSKTMKWSIIQFAASLLWIAIFSTALYEWLLVACNSIGIPSNVAALTLLAGGTSIPDLLSSYVVAKQGEGDMAVSSSIGSNIFDVTVGLPLPWICYIIANGGEPVAVVAASLGESIIVLMIMLALVIGSIMIMKWKMTKSLGGLMMLFYVIFLVFNIGFAPVM